MPGTAARRSRPARPRQIGRRDLAAARAAAFVEQVLADLRQHRRDLDDLVTADLARGILGPEAAMAAPASLGHDLDPWSTCSGGKGLRVVPLCPGWPPGLRPVGFLLRRSFHGLSVDGGCEEFVESAFKRAVSSRTFSWRTALCSRSSRFSRMRLARLASRWHLRRSEASSFRSVLRSRASSCATRLCREDRPVPMSCESVDSSPESRAERLRLRVSVHRMPQVPRLSAPRFPPNDGFFNPPTDATLRPGMRIDRYGPHSGKFASPEGTPAAARSLPPGRASEPIRSFEVLKPLEVEEGLAAPAFGQPGMGTQ